MSINTNDYKSVYPFKAWVQKVLPTIYDDSLSYYDLLGKVLNHLNILTENNNLLIEDMKQLYGYVNNYFANLDVQEEINNKLDEMASDGTLDKIISKYITTEVLFTFDTLGELLEYDINVGSFYMTQGYADKFDGGRAYYKCVDTLEESKWQIESHGKYLELINDNPVNLKVFGGHTDFEILKKAFKYAIDNKYNIIGRGAFNVSETLVVTERINIDVDLFIATENIDYILKFDLTNAKENLKKYMELKLAIDCNNLSGGVQFIETSRCNIDFIECRNISKIGLENVSGYELIINNGKFYGNYGNCTGLKLITSDYIINDIILLDCNIGIDIIGSGILNNVHGWIGNHTLLPKSKFIQISEEYTECIFNNIYSDTYQTSIYCKNNFSNLLINGFLVNFNPTIYNQSVVKNDPRYVFYFENTTELNYLPRICVSNYTSTSQKDNIIGIMYYCNVENKISFDTAIPMINFKPIEFESENCEILENHSIIYTSKYAKINLTLKVKNSVTGNLIGEFKNFNYPTNLEDLNRYTLNIVSYNNEYTDFNTILFGNIYLKNGQISCTETDLTKNTGKMLHIETIIPVGLPL